MPRSLTKTRFTAIALSFALVCASLFPVTGRADSKIRIMTATTDLASLAQEIGGDKVDVESVARGYQDPHFVDPKPSFLLKLSKAELLIVVGLELEIGWLPPLITQSSNPRIQVGAPGSVQSGTIVLSKVPLPLRVLRWTSCNCCGPSMLTPTPTLQSRNKAHHSGLISVPFV